MTSCRIARLNLIILMAILSSAAAAEDAYENCRTAKADTAVSVCSHAIDSGQYAGDKLAMLYKLRAENLDALIQNFLTRTPTEEAITLIGVSGPRHSMHAALRS